MLFEHLTSLGQDVLAVSDAQHAVALLIQKESNIEVTIMDLNMPRLGGDVMMKTFAKWVRCRTRFIIMSGEPEIVEYENHPAVIGCLDKPFSINVLGDLVNKAQITTSENLSEVAS